MNLLIDPSVLCQFEAGISSAEKANVLRHRLASLTTLVRGTGARLIFTSELWRKFQKDAVGPVVASVVDPQVRTPLQMLRNSVRMMGYPNDAVAAWGFAPLLADVMGAGQFWADAYAALAAELIRSGEEVRIFTALIPGKNLEVHSSANTHLFEKTRWRLYVRCKGLPGTGHVPCITSLRNVQVPWTTRFDERLPDSRPAGGYEFRVPANWHLRSLQSFRTHLGKPCWKDGSGIFWADPNTPGDAYHWDVYFEDVATSPIGISPVNIVRWGVPAAEGVPGSVHHIPTALRSRAT
jgi:hypothetical protein